MGVRPPQSDSGGLDPVEFGIPVVADRLDGMEVSYPVTDRELVKGLGDPEIPIDAQGHSIALSTAMEEVSKTEFDSERELLDALHPVFEERRASTATGLLGSFKAMLPF